MIAVECSSARGVPATAVQAFVGFAPGGIVPVHVTETVWPAADGTVIELDGGVDAPARPTASASVPAMPARRVAALPFMSSLLSLSLRR